MAEFVWEARARTGEVRKGTMIADDEEGVLQKLRAQQLNPTKVKKKAKELKLSVGSGVGGKDLVTFTRLLTTMIDAGLPIVQCLEILGGQTENKVFAGILRDIKSQVEQGSTFSDALRRHPKVFDELYVNLVQAGEAGGILDTILARLAQYNEKAMKLKRQVIGALVYPSIVVLVFMGVSVILLGFVIPSFKTIFKDLGSSDELPALTQGVIFASEVFVGNLLFFIAGALAIVAWFWWSYPKPKFRRVYHHVMLRMPVLGSTLRKIAVARFTRTMGTLLASGVPILDAMEIVAKVSGNMVIEEGLMYTRTKISEGKTMVEPLSETKIFPPMVTQMIGVGEQTGALDSMLNKIADFYEEEVDVAVAAMTSLIEPVMMVGLGGTVGVVLIAMYLPIFSMAGKIKG